MEQARLALNQLILLYFARKTIILIQLLQNGLDNLRLLNIITAAAREVAALLKFYCECVLPLGSCSYIFSVHRIKFVIFSCFLQK